MISPRLGGEVPNARTAQVDVGAAGVLFDDDLQGLDRCSERPRSATTLAICWSEENAG